MTAVSQAYRRCNEKPPHGNAGANLPMRKQTSPMKLKREDGSTFILKGKTAQVMRVLLGNVKSGVTLLDFSLATFAFRAANHLSILRRKYRVKIETTYEPAKDCPRIGRYWLREPLQIVEGAA